MTTATLPAEPAVIADDADDLAAASGFAGCFLLPLAEFGQSLDNPGLDWWLEDFAGRNQGQGDYEITARGELKIMPPTGFPFDLHEARMTASVVNWADDNGGLTGGPTSRFTLPDDSRRGPDAWWTSEARWRSASLSARTRTFAAVVPDFVAEIVSPSNRGPELADKVRRYLEGGARLIWVIDARRRRVTIYRPGMAPEVLDDPEALDGEDVMPGFVFEVRGRIFDYSP